MESKQAICWCDGEIVDSKCISVSDSSYSLGVGIFETVAAYNGCLIDFDRHMKRLQDSLAKSGLEDVNSEFILAGANKLLSELGLLNTIARVRVTVSDVVTIVANEVSKPQAAAILKTVSYRRNETSALVGMKSTSYGDNVIALREVRAAGADEALFLNTAGEVCEGATSNLFLITNLGVITPPLSSGCLPGVTRAVVMELCREKGIHCEERVIDQRELSDAKGICLTGSLRGIQSVSEFDGRKISTEEQDEYQMLKNLYQTHIKEQTSKNQ